MLDAKKFQSEDAQQVLLQEQENLMKQLENRAQPNLFQVAGALARPTKTGNWIEALGAGSEEYGRQVAEQEKLEPSLIQMRAQLGAQRFEMQNKAEANKALAGMLGVGTPEEAYAKLSSGDVTPDELQNLIKGQALLATKSKDVGEIANNFVKNTINLKDVGIKERTENRAVAKEVQEYVDKYGVYPAGYKGPRNLMGETEEPVAKPAVNPTQFSSLFGDDLRITSPFGQRTLNGKEEMHGGIDLAPINKQAGSPIKSPLDGEVIYAGDVKGYGKAVYIRRDDGHIMAVGHVDPAVEKGARIKQGDIIGNIGENMGKTTGHHAEIQIMSPDGKPINPMEYNPLMSLLKPKDVLVASNDPYAGLPRDLQKKAKELDLEESKKFRSSIPAMKDEANIYQRNGSVIATATSKYPEAFGLLRKNPSLGQTIANYLQNGINFGKFSASIPIEETLAKNLSKPEQQARQIVESALSGITIEAASKMKGSVSNYEDKMVQRVSGSAENLPQFLNYIGNRVRAEGEFKKDYANAYEKAHDANPLLTQAQFDKREGSKLRDEFHNYVDGLAKKSLGLMK
jgi:murein DD-endopeptidase MepM/ murein hydrolase activator NlpD